MTIIDVSYHNGDIDFNKVKAAGVEGVIIRAGYGQNHIDKKFETYINAAINAGLKVGVYWFSYAYTVEMAKREAEYCLRAVNAYKLELPIFFDWEYDSMKYASRNGVNADKVLITDMIVGFCNVVKDNGRSAGYYGSLDYFKNYIDTSKLDGFTKWLARYTNQEQTDCDLWQYTSTGKVDGINGNVDMNNVVNASFVTVDKSVNTVDNSSNSTNSADGAKSNSEKVSDTKMPTIKNGSKGKAVKIWQVIVGVNADGIFGNNTKAATESFQRSHGLGVDGIVGPKSWKAGLESV